VKVLLWAESDRVEQEIKSSERVLNLFENTFERAIDLHVQRQQKGEA
jgi:hypothetical protein